MLSKILGTQRSITVHAAEDVRILRRKSRCEPAEAAASGSPRHERMPLPHLFLSCDRPANEWQPLAPPRYVKASAETLFLRRSFTVWTWELTRGCIDGQTFVVSGCRLRALS